MMKESSTVCIGVVVLNYNNAKDTIDCIKDVLANDYKNFSVAVVDNHSTDDSLAEIESYIQELDSPIEIVLIKSPINGGYAFGNNLGIKFFIEDNDNFSHVCILNNDIKIPSNLLQSLVDHSESHPAAGILGPVICRWPDNNQQKGKSIVQSAGAKYNFWKGTNVLLHKNISLNQVIKKPITCDYISGACMLIRKQTIKQIGMIPENYFLYYEETEWCFKAQKYGINVVCFPDTVVFHKGSETINSINGLATYFMERNRVLFENRNAQFYHLPVFYIYIFIRVFLKGFFRKEIWQYIPMYIDGITGKNRYSFLIK